MTFLAQDPGRLARFRAGDRSTLAEVYDHYLDGLARVVRMGFRLQTDDGPRIVPPMLSTFEVESLCHDVFLRAFSEPARHAYDGERPFGTWLMRIARNLRIDAWRRDRRLQFTDEQVELAVPAEAEEDLLDQELRSLVRAFVDTLPDLDRAYYEARFRTEASQTTAAAACGLTRIQGRRIEARIKAGLVDYLVERGVERGHGGRDDDL
ncbi:MAG: sigma-70 family RNA polymerase sigma factor [bacterium]